MRPGRPLYSALLYSLLREEDFSSFGPLPPDLLPWGLGMPVGMVEVSGGGGAVGVAGAGPDAVGTGEEKPAVEDLVLPEDEEEEEVGVGLVVGMKLPNLELFLENVGLEWPRRGSPRSSLLPGGPATLRLCPGELPGTVVVFGDEALGADDDTLN